MPEDLDPTSLGETPRSISKARMSMKSNALILIKSQAKNNSLEHDAEWIL